jgi:protein tyrosine phosphatase
VGRTGTFIAIDRFSRVAYCYKIRNSILAWLSRIFDAIEAKKPFDILEIVTNMRQARNLMVQALVCIALEFVFNYEYISLIHTICCT